MLMNLRRPRDRAAFVVAAVFAQLAWADAGASDGLRDLGHELDRAGRNLCVSLKLQCKENTARKSAQVERIVTAPGANGAAKPVPPPLPRQKPGNLARVGTKPPKPPVLAPIPRPNPAAVAFLPLGPGQRIVPHAPPPGPGEQCLAALREASVDFEMVAMPAGTGACLVTNPVRVSAVTTLQGRIALTDRPILNCRFARQFAAWLSDAGAGIVSARLNTTLTKVSTGPGFQCRTRNGDPSAKLSEHAFGDAVDITTLTTAGGQTIAVADALNPASPSHPALQELRASACGYFTTVLGPGANAAHASHFHFDMELRGKNRAYRICQ